MPPPLSTSSPDNGPSANVDGGLLASSTGLASTDDNNSNHNNSTSNNNNTGDSSSGSTAAPSIAVFLFAKEKLLFRYPDTDPFVVDVSTSGSATGSSSAAAAETASKKSGNTTSTNENNSNLNNNNNNGASGRGGEASSSVHSATSSSSSTRDRHRRGNSSGGALLHPDTFATTPTTPTAATTTTTTTTTTAMSGGSRLKKKSPHVHVTMAADVKDRRGGSPHGSSTQHAPRAASSSEGGVSGAGVPAASSGSTSGVAPQRGMRRPMSAYTLVNDSLNSSLAFASSTSQAHRTASPKVGGALETRRGSHMKGGSLTMSGVGGPNNNNNNNNTSNSHGIGGGMPGGPTTQVQHTSTGSTRRQNSASSLSASTRSGSKSMHAAGTRASAAQQQQQQQQQQHTTGAATCVGIATNVLMHLLRGALNGCTTINMVNCTFLVFPLNLAMSGSPGASVTSHRDGGGGHHTHQNSINNTGGTTCGTAAQDRSRSLSRSATALLVVAMKQPDTDTGAIANFAQCFVNILCREEQRCRYVSNELDTMEALTNHWEVGGAAAVANAAADMRQQQQHHQQQQQQQQLLDFPSASTSQPSSHRAGSAASAQHSHSSSPLRGSTLSQRPHSPHEIHSPTEVAAAAAADRTHCDYDYLFAAPRPALRSGKTSSSAAYRDGNTNGPLQPPPATSAAAHRSNSHNGHGGAGGGHGVHREASPNATGGTTSWADVDYYNDGGEAEEGGAGRNRGGSSSSRAASPSSTGRDGAARRRGAAGNGLPTGAGAASLNGTMTGTGGLMGTSLYQQLAGYVRLASEVQQVAQCIDLWNRTSRVREGLNGTYLDTYGRRLPRSACRNFFGTADAARALNAGGSGGGAASLTTAVNGRLRSGAASTAATTATTTTSGGGASRDPFRRYSNVGTSPQQQQQQQLWVTAAPGEVLEALPDAILVNRMLLLPMSHLTGQERLEQVQTMRSAYSRIHPCSVVTVEEGLFTEELQRSYVDMMGRRYAKLIPLATVYALLQALPSPRRAGSLYRSIELTLLEAVQRRHARAAAAAAAAAAATGGNNSTNASTTTPTVSVSGANFSGAHTVSAGSYPVLYGGSRTSRDALDEEAPSSSAVAAAAATTAAGLDFLAMEIIDFLRVNGAITVASEMWVCFTHGEITPVEYVTAALERRRRHRRRAERRQQKAAAAAAAAAVHPPSPSQSAEVPQGVPHSRHHHHHPHEHHSARRKDRHQRSCTQAPELLPQQQQQRPPHSPPDGLYGSEFDRACHREGTATLPNSSWVSSEATTVAMDDAAYGATEPSWAAPASDPFEEVRDMDTVPAALVLHMLERVVDAQHPSPPPQQQQQQQQQHTMPYAQPHAPPGSASFAPTSASVASFNGGGGFYGLGGSRYNNIDTETMSNTTAGMPQSPSTGNTIPAAANTNSLNNSNNLNNNGGGGLARTPRSSETDTSAGRASYKGSSRPLDTSAAAAQPLRSSASSLQQQQQTTTHSTSAAVSTASSPPLHYASHSQQQQQQQQQQLSPARGASAVNATGGFAPSASSTSAAPSSQAQTQRQQQSQSQPQQQRYEPPTAQLAVYCAWGSACPLCEQLASHPQCWTATVNRGYTVGYYVLNTSARHLRHRPPLQLDFPSLDASVCTCARHARRLRDHADLTSLMQSSYSISGGGSMMGQRSNGGGSSGLLHSLQPWFIRPHMFVTPVTTAYGVSPYEIYERMSYHSNRSANNNSYNGSGAGLSRSSACNSAAAAGVPIMVPVNNTSSLVEPERRDMLAATRASQANTQDVSGTAATNSSSTTAAPTARSAGPVPGNAATRRGAVVGAAEEQGHTLLQCPDIPDGAVEYLQRCADVIQRRLAHSRAQQAALARFEQACEHDAAVTATAAAAAAGGGGSGHVSSTGKRLSSSPLSTTTASNANVYPYAHTLSGAGMHATSVGLSRAERESQQTSASSPSPEDTVSEGAATTSTTTATTVFNKSAALSASASSAAAGATHGVGATSAMATANPAPATTAAAAAPVSASRPIATTPSMPVASAGVAVAVNVVGRSVTDTADGRPASPLLSSSQPGLSKLSSSADVRPRSIRYGRRQLPLHTATSPLTNVNLLFDSATPTVAVMAGGTESHAEHSTEGKAPQPQQQQQQQQMYSGSSHADSHARLAGAAAGTAATVNTNTFPYAGVNDLLAGDRSLPVEVLLQYVLHHLIALSWGRRGVEVDTLVRLLERNLRRLPPLLANLQYVRQLRSAGFTSESAAAAVAALRAPAGGAAGTTTTSAATGAADTPMGITSPSSAVFTAVHTRLAASPFSVSPGARPSPSNLTDTPEDNSDTSPYSGGSRAATAMPVTESEVQLLQAYEVLERLSLMDLLSSYATWPVRTVPTRLLLHTVVNEFCDVLFVDSSEREEEVDHWDLPVAAQ